MWRSHISNMTGDKASWTSKC